MENDIGHYQSITDGFIIITHALLVSYSRKKLNMNTKEANIINNYISLLDSNLEYKQTFSTVIITFLLVREKQKNNFYCGWNILISN